MHLQPRLHAPVDSLPTLTVIVTFPVDSQCLWQVRLVQQKEFGSYAAHQTSRAIIPLTEAKANPLHSALRTNYACSLLSSDELRRICVEEPVKATNRGQPWKEAEQLTSTDFFQRIHHCFNEIGASPRMRQEFAEYHAGKQARKQEKLAYKRQKKHPDDADHWTGQQWSQRTKNAGWVEGWHEPASSSSFGWHSQWLGLKETRSYPTSRATRSAIQCCVVEKKKKKHRPGNMNRSPHQSRDHEPAGVGCAPKHSLCGQARASEPAGPPTTLPITPALRAFIGPKNSTMPW